MADYNVLKSSVAAVIKTNNRREITGQLLQNVLTQMINVIGDNFQLAGFADPTTNPQSPDQNVFYVAEQSGVYPYFDNIIVPEGVTFLLWKNSQWTAHTIGVVTTEYLAENYVTKEFFRSMFRAYDSHGVEIEPNNDGDEPSVIDNIKAMVGLWTNEYISALGQGSGGGGGGGSTSLAGLTDVAINPQTLAGGQALIYNATTHKWVNGSVVVNMASVWSALAASTNEQINASHLSSALQGFATETWVSQNFISIAYFDRLFRAYNGNTLVSHNDETSTIDNIKAMFGFWTEQYLSALGNSGGGSVSLTLANMGDVALNNLADGQILVYDATEGKWVNESASIVGNYLPLTGGTLTGDLVLTQGVRIMSGGQAMLVYKPSGLTGISRTQWGVGAIDIQGVIRSSASDLLHRRGISGQSYAILDEYNATTILDNSYLPLTGGTLTGDLFFTGYNSRVFGIKRTSASAGQSVANNIDVGWDYNNRDGAGAFFRSVEAGTLAGDFGFFARNATDQCEMIGKPDGTLTWGNANVLTSANVKTINNESIFGTGNISVTGNYLPLTGGTLTGRLTIDAGVLNITGESGYAQGIRIHDSGGYSSIFFRCTAATGNNNGMWGLTAYSSGLGIRGTSSTSSSTLNYYLSI
ncbi:MAG: hypothetical protein IIU59_03115, partial [Alistipes sp.]|nr:hypothetical protein [Alistipes sp.]